MDMDYAAIGKRVARYRDMAKLTQAELAERADISVGMVSTVEAGRTKASIETLVKLSNALNATVDAFLYDYLDDKEAVLIGRIKKVTGRFSQKQLEFLADNLEIQKLIMDAAENK